MGKNMDKEVEKILSSLKSKDVMATPPVKQESKRVEAPLQPGKPKPQTGEMVSQPGKANPNTGSWLTRLRKCFQQQKPSIRWSVIAAVAVLLLAIILLFRGCAGGDVLKGTWSLDGTTVYQFKGNGKGAMVLPNKTYAFKYTVNEKEKTVDIDFEDEKAKDNSYAYQVSDHQLLLSANGFTHQFTRTEKE